MRGGDFLRRGVVHRRSVVFAAQEHGLYGGLSPELLQGLHHAAYGEVLVAGAVDEARGRLHGRVELQYVVVHAPQGIGHRRAEDARRVGQHRHLGPGKWRSRRETTASIISGNRGWTVDLRCRRTLSRRAAPLSPSCRRAWPRGRPPPFRAWGVRPCPALGVVARLAVDAVERRTLPSEGSRFTPSDTPRRRLRTGPNIVEWKSMVGLLPLCFEFVECKDRDFVRKNAVMPPRYFDNRR